jgi:hypothetical protein
MLQLFTELLAFDESNVGFRIKESYFCVVKNTKTESKKYWGQYKDALGRLKRVPLAVDLFAVQAMLNDLVK